MSPKHSIHLLLSLIIDPNEPYWWKSLQKSFGQVNEVNQHSHALIGFTATAKTKLLVISRLCRSHSKYMQIDMHISSEAPFPITSFTVAG